MTNNKLQIGHERMKKLAVPLSHAVESSATVKSLNPLSIIEKRVCV
jgi:hypothetical protein